MTTTQQMKNQTSQYGGYLIFAVLGQVKLSIFMVLHGSLHFKKERNLTYEIYISRSFPSTEDKKYNAFFSRILPAVKANGDTLDDAIENANAAAYDWIYTELMEFEGKLPPVSDESDLELQEGDVVRNISVNIRFQDGWDE